MFQKRKELLKMLVKFQTICEENKIWYSADGTTLLGIVRHAGFVPWEEKIELMINNSGLDKLKRLFPKNIVDMSEIKNSKSLYIVFVNDSKDITSPQPFIKIRILVPTTVKKIYWFKSYRYKIFNMLNFRTINLRNSITDLHDDQFQGYLLLEKSNQDVIQTWIQTLNFQILKKKLNKIDVPIPNEYKIILKRWYGNYMTPLYPKIRKNYISPLKTKKETF